MVVSGSLSKNRRQRLSRRAHQVSGLLAAGLTVVALLFLTGLFEDLPAATRGGRNRRGLELVDMPALVELYDMHTRRPSVASSDGSLASIHRRGGRAARGDGLRDLPGLFIGIAVSLLLLIYRPRDPTSRCSAALAGAARTATSHSPRRTTAGRHRRHEDRERLYFANAENVRSRILDAGGAVRACGA